MAIIKLTKQELKLIKKATLISLIATQNHLKTETVFSDDDLNNYYKKLNVQLDAIIEKINILLSIDIDAFNVEIKNCKNCN